MISVIVPIYNAESTLARCLESITGQTCRDIEILCIDDGSTDRSSLIARDFMRRDRRIRIFTLEQNQGLSVARNTGLEHASGEFIAFVDSDDELVPETLETCLKAFTGDVDSVWFKTSVMGEDKAFCASMEKVLNRCGEGTHIVDDGFLLENCITTCWSKLYRKAHFDRYHIRFPRGCFFEDEVLFFNYFSMFRKIRIIGDKLYVYHVHKNSIMGRKRNREENVSIQAIYLIGHIYGFWNEHGLLKGRERVLEAIMERLIKSAMAYAPPFEQARCVWEAAKILRSIDLPYENSWLRDLRDGTYRIAFGGSDSDNEKDSLKIQLDDCKNELHSLQCAFEELQDSHGSLLSRLELAAKRNASFRQRNARLQKDGKMLLLQLKRIRQAAKHRQKKTLARIAALKRSASWRIGRAVTWPFRKARKLWRR